MLAVRREQGRDSGGNQRVQLGATRADVTIEDHAQNCIRRGIKTLTVPYQVGGDLSTLRRMALSLSPEARAVVQFQGMGPTPLMAHQMSLEERLAWSRENPAPEPISAASLVNAENMVRIEFAPRLAAIFEEDRRRHSEASEAYTRARDQLDVEFRKRLAEVEASQEKP